MKYLACLFDFDYTLGDATEGIVASVNYALRRLNLPLAQREEIRKTVGLTLSETFEQLTGISDPAICAQYLGYFREKADETMTANTKLFPDTLRILEHLKSRNMKIGIVTTKYRYRIVEILRKYKISQLVDVIIGGEDVKKAKPDPEGLLHALEILDIPSEKALYVGDSLVDAKTAAAAGVDFVAVTTGTTCKAAFLDFPLKRVISGLSELMD